MPHICTRCNNTFESGEDILKGCPVCGWKKFMFVRRLAAEDRRPSEQIISKAMGVRNPPREHKRGDQDKDGVTIPAASRITASSQDRS